MLGKLFKYEFKSTYKIMLTIYAVLLGVTGYGILVVNGIQISDQLDFLYSTPSLIVQLLLFSVFLLYILSIAALFVVTYVYMCMHFYKTMFSDQGYLTHTLPVTPLATLNVKLITSLFWMVCSTVMFFLSMFLLFAGAARSAIFDIFSNISVSEMFEFSKDIQSVLGMNLGSFLCLMAVSVVINCLSYLLMVFTSICIGQLFNQHKVLASIVAGIVIYFTQQTFSSMISILTGDSMFGTSTVWMNDMVTAADLLWTPPFIGSYILTLLFLAAFYVTCVIILRKHINLD